MELNQVDTHYLIAAISVITSALLFYTVGVWSERIQGGLKFWHLVLFLLGLLCDAVGTALMAYIAQLAYLRNELHMVTGVVAILIMFVHAMWAIWIYVQGSPQAKSHFSSFSIGVWFVWLIPYFIGVYLGMSLQH